MPQNNTDAEDSPHGQKTVIAARFSALGDVAMCIPVLYSACRCYPQKKFVFVTRPSMTGIFVNAPSNLTIVGADVKKEFAGIAGLYRLVRKLCEEYRPEAFIDLHNVLRTMAMRFFFRMRGVRTAALNKGRDSKRALTRRSHKVMLPLISSRARYRETFFKVGLPLEERFHGLYGHGKKADVKSFIHITGQEKQPGEIWIGIAPFAAHAGKIYPPEKMEQVVRLISDRGDCRIFIFGGGGKEAEITAKWASQHPCVTSLCGKKYGFEAELALISHLDTMLSMDSANMHLAAIAGTRTVSVWGATHPYCGFKAWHQKDCDIVQLPLPCRPCSVFGDKPCHRGDMMCLNGIKPEMLYTRIFNPSDN